MEEVWKDIAEYEGLYQVSNMGRVKSLSRMKWSGLNGGCYVNTKEKILQGSVNDKGYKIVTLCGKQKYIHRLVAIAFIPNPDRLPMINHKDEVKTNNKVENLEWCDSRYNINYGTRTGRMAEKLRGRKLSEEHKKKVGDAHRGKKRSIESVNKTALARRKAVKGIHKITGNIVKFNSVKEASETLGICGGHICACCKGTRKSAGDYMWYYV